jgi:glycosyltransferase involved in cell wall biosynthesis
MHVKKPRYVILTNIIAPYKTLLFNALQEKNTDFRVLYFAETEGNREWRVAKGELQFAFDVMFKGKIDYIGPIELAIETYKKLNLYDPEVIIIGGYDRLACWAALVWAKKRNRKVILMIESHYLDRPRFAIKESSKRLLVSRCDAILAAGTRHRDYAIRLGAKSENIFIMRGVGGVDLSLYQTAVLEGRGNKLKLCNELGIPCKKYFLYVGRFSPEKNLLFLLKAYKKLKSKEGASNWGLLLVGDGPQRKEIESFIKNNGIRDTFLPGFIQKEELPRFYAISDVFVLPSISDAWGLVVEEAMVSGLPVLVSNRCGCYPDVVRDGINGFSFDPFNEDELFRYMKDIALGELELKEMGRASLEIIKDYTPEKSADVFWQAVESIVGVERKEKE